jgi:uncharacterized protein (TIGR03435 family)
LAVQQRLVREILEDRFGMRAHVEQREQAVYALRLIKPGVLGPGVVEVEYNCMDPETAREALRRSVLEAETGLMRAVWSGAGRDRSQSWCPGCRAH